MRPLSIIGFLLYIVMIIVPSGQSQTLKPLHPGNKSLVVESGHTTAYYALSKDTPSYLLVKGPGKLKVSSRVIMKQGDHSKDYSIFYRIDGGDLVKQNYHSTAASVKAVIKGVIGKLGVPKTFEIELGPGEHSLEFTSFNSDNLILANYSIKKNKAKKTRWIMLSPSYPNEPVDLVTHENVVHYYRFSQKKPLKIRINGPTTLRILTRFENHFNMKGRINYRLQVKENQKVIHTYLLSSVFSEVTTYKKNNKLIPGKAREFYIEVPSGRHIYSIVPLDKDKNTILARVLFPKKDVKLEE